MEKFLQIILLNDYKSAAGSCACELHVLWTIHSSHDIQIWIKIASRNIFKYNCKPRADKRIVTCETSVIINNKMTNSWKREKKIANEI